MASYRDFGHLDEMDVRIDRIEKGWRRRAAFGAAAVGLAAGGGFAAHRRRSMGGGPLQAHIVRPRGIGTAPRALGSGPRALGPGPRPFSAPRPSSAPRPRPAGGGGFRIHSQRPASLFPRRGGSLFRKQVDIALVKALSPAQLQQRRDAAKSNRGGVRGATHRGYTAARRFNRGNGGRRVRNAIIAGGAGYIALRRPPFGGASSAMVRRQSDDDWN